MNSVEADKNGVNIQLVGCAKNEAAYLPEWIFYHINIGFSSIKIYINNTNDNSIEVLDKIKNKYPQVSYVLADELIANPPAEYKTKTNDNFFNTNNIQAVVYTDALQTLLHERNKTNTIDYLAFLDIDEFFVPSKPLDELFPVNPVMKLPLRFNWILLSGDNKAFSPLSECRKGFHDSSFKSIVPVNESNVRAEDPHRFSINGHIGELSSAGVILHRVLRSKKEYLYLLSRSTSNQKNKLTNGFKRNRRGWTSRGKSLTHYNIAMDANHSAALKAFILECEISEDVKHAEQKILESYNTIVKSIDMIKQQNLELTRSLGGTEVSHLGLVKTGMHLLAWRLISLLSPQFVLSHESILDLFLSKLRLKRDESSTKK
jgi:hypothetical protein